MIVIVHETILFLVFVGIYESVWNRVTLVSLYSTTRTVLYLPSTVQYSPVLNNVNTNEYRNTVEGVFDPLIDTFQHDTGRLKRGVPISISISISINIVGWMNLKS